jgi:Raf kinase inhibitor-like YbhB/YbcL family protein
MVAVYFALPGLRIRLQQDRHSSTGSFKMMAIHSNHFKGEVIDMEGVKKFCLFLMVLLPLSLGQKNVFGGNAMEISSAAFKDGEKIPIQYVMPGAGGKNISIPLAWKDVPAGTKSFCLSIVDPHPVAQNWVHWLVINIPAQVTSIEEGASRKRMPKGSTELKNSFGEIGYGGPQPPQGTGDHPYVVTLYALNVEKFDLAASTSLSAFKKATEGKVIGSATITGKYGR